MPASRHVGERSDAEESSTNRHNFGRFILACWLCAAAVRQDLPQPKDAPSPHQVTISWSKSIGRTMATHLQSKATPGPPLKSWPSPA